MGRKSTNDANGQFPVLEHLVVESNEKTSDILCLRQVSVELFIQILEYRPTYKRSCLSAFGSDTRRLETYKNR